MSETNAVFVFGVYRIVCEKSTPDEPCPGEPAGKDDGWHDGAATARRGGAAGGCVRAPESR